ncbi:hypothetical protein Barb6_01923 [Bacteroidales bacterium Barb6]|nr:hypothetical protein Barb6_01923 [Bacteroidales bacterium Barb6]
MGRNNNSDEIKKYRREFYSKYFGNLSTIVFTVFVVGNAVSLIRGSEDYVTDLMVLIAGVLFTLPLILIANKFIK